MTKNNNGAEVDAVAPARAMRIYLSGLVSSQVLLAASALVADSGERYLSGIPIVAFYVAYPLVWWASGWRLLAKHRLVLAGFLSVASVVGMAFVLGGLHVLLFFPLVVMLPAFVLAAIWDQESGAHVGKQEVPPAMPETLAAGRTRGEGG